MKGLSLAHFWSLCVEEQFYLVWPAVVYFVRKRETLLHICAAYIVFAPVLRMMYVMHHPEWRASDGLYMSTPFRLDSLLWGAALALWLRASAWTGSQKRRAAHVVLAAVPALFAVALLIAPMTGDTTNHLNATVTVGFSLFAAGSCALLLLVLDETTSLHRMLRKPLLGKLGRISYGAYVFHIIFLQSLPAVLPGQRWLLLRPFLALALTIATAAVSYRFYETPFLLLKEKLAPHHAVTAGTGRQDADTVQGEHPVASATARAKHLTSVVAIVD